jgi:single-stranded-DNA-specific exonuclease
MIHPHFHWRAPDRVALDAAFAAAGRDAGISERLLSVLAARGVADAVELRRFLAPPEEGLHDPRLLPDAAAALARVKLARERNERALVYGDFDADGLTGLSIAVIALRLFGIDAEPYVPERVGDGHGLSLRAIDRAVAENRTLIVTADCGTSSSAEIDLAVSRGVDVIVTDHHHAPTWPAGAVAVVNPQRTDSAYPEKGLTGAGVAWKFAHLLLGEFHDGERPILPDSVRELADLALIGSVADVAPMLGENRSIAKLGLERLRTAARPGLAALMTRAGVAPDRLDTDGIGFAIAPRLNAAGRVGEAGRAARLLLADDAAEAAALADEIDKANMDRRELTKVALGQAREILGLDRDGHEAAAGGQPVGAAAATATTAAIAAALPAASAAGGPAASTPVAGREPLARPEPLAGPEPIAAPTPIPAGAVLVRGDWPVGIIGLIAGRLAEDLGRPAVVATLVDTETGILRASCRSAAGINLAETLIECQDLLIRHGGHAAAAGFDIEAGRWVEFETRFLAVIAASPVAPMPDLPELKLDLVLRADEVDYALIRELGLLDPTGLGNPVPMIGISGFKVQRVRSAAGGHTQLVLKRTRDVLDAIAFRRADLASNLHEGDHIDVAARAGSRRFGGVESMQLEVVDVAAAGTQPGMHLMDEVPVR